MVCPTYLILRLFISRSPADTNYLGVRAQGSPVGGDVNCSDTKHFKLKTMRGEAGQLESCGKDSAGGLKTKFHGQLIETGVGVGYTFWTIFEYKTGVKDQNGQGCKGRGAGYSQNQGLRGGGWGLARPPQSPKLGAGQCSYLDVMSPPPPQGMVENFHLPIPGDFPRYYT